METYAVMTMNELTAYLSPTVLVFLVIALGYYVGKIRVRRLSLGLAAVLLCAVAVGGLISFYPLKTDTAYISSLQSSMKCFSSLGTALFVSVVGLSSGYSFSRSFHLKDIFHVLFGALVVLAGFGTMKLIEWLDINISRSALLGILCGALTSTPGMSAACEQSETAAEEVALGYGSAYLFGIIFVVLLTQLLTDRKRSQTAEEKEQQAADAGRPLETLVSIGIVVILGTVIGNLSFFHQRIALGTSGGILLVGILTGFLTQRCFADKISAPATASLYRNTGLMLFFAGAGIPAGFQLREALQPKWMIYDAVITVLPILEGYIFI